MVGEDGHLTGGVDEVLFLDELVIVTATGVGEDFEVGSAGCGGGVGGVAVGLDVRGG